MQGQGTIAIQATQPRTFNPALVQKHTVTVRYEVYELSNPDCGYLCNAVPSASYHHKGNRWTLVSLPARDEGDLLRHLRDNRSVYVKL